MASKITQQTASAPAETASGKAAAQPPAKAETAEDLRRRRAGIACFL